MIDKMKVYQDTELSSKAVSVYLYLCERASKETKSCYPSMKTIAKDLHLSLASVKRSIQELESKCVADYHRLIRGCDVLCLLDCGQWTVPMYALQIQKGLFHWKVEHEGLSYDIFYCLEKVAFVCRDGLYSGESVLYSIHSNIGSFQAGV